MMLQSFQSTLRLCPKLHGIVKSPSHNCSSSHSTIKKKKKKKKQASKRQSSSSADSYASMGSSSRPNSGSLTSSSGTLATLSHSSGHSRKSTRSSPKQFVTEKKKTERGPLKVSINETAELIEDIRHREDDEDETFSIDSATSQVRQEREKRALAGENETTENEVTGKE